MMSIVLPIAFWLAAFLLVYLYAGYPVVAWCRARTAPNRHRREPIVPTVSVLVVAHDEGERIGQRIQNLLDLDYPTDRLDIVIASDGSADDTVSRARAFAGSRVDIRAFSSRRGKAAVLNDIVPVARGEIIVLADARQQFEPDAVRALVSNFADPEIGAVSGELILSSGQTSTADGVSFYWRYEKFMRRHESARDSTIGATGAICAIRGALFDPIPPDTILDDVLIPLRIVRRGYRVLFDSRARAVDRPSESARDEYVRKTRTIAGTFQLFWRERWLWNPFGNRLWLETMSHKGLRLMSPALLATALACAIGLSDRPLYGLLLVGQAAFYAAALMGWGSRAPSPESRGPSRLLSVPYAVCLLNWATFVGFVRFIAGVQHATWDRATLEPARPPAGKALLRS
jgi:poly-beta-1,6-N-acetyl-D-glucosamine synthase